MKTPTWLLILVPIVAGLFRPADAQTVDAGDIEAFVFMTRANPPQSAPGNRVNTAADEFVIEPGRQARIGRFAPSFSSALSVDTVSFGEILVDNFDNAGLLELQILATVPANLEPLRCIALSGDVCTRWEQFFTTVRINAPSLPDGVAFEGRDCLPDLPPFGGLPSPFTTEERDVLLPLVGSAVIGCAATLRWSPGLEDVGFYGLAIDVDLMRVRLVMSATSTVVLPQFPTPGVQLPVNVSVSAARIRDIELTQAIQELQPLAEFEQAARTGELPVPLVADKPLVIRAYPAVTERRGRVTARLTLYDPEFDIGIVEVLEDVVLSPRCTPRARRLQETTSSRRCRSLDFDVPVPPEGDFVGHLVLEDGRGNVITHETFDIPVDEASDRLVLKSVAVCLDGNPETGLAVNCADQAAARFGTRIGLLKKIAPTAEITVYPTQHQIAGRSVVPLSDGVPDPKACFDGEGNVVEFASPDAIQCTPEAWWTWVLTELVSLPFEPDDRIDNPAEEVLVYYGVTPAFATNRVAGMGAYLGHPLVDGVAAGMARLVLPDFGNTDLTEFVVAHETGHAAGLLHAPAGNALSSMPPGCFAESPADQLDPDWPFTDSRLRSERNPLTEVGYDTDRGVALAGNVHFDVMSYCWPSWISSYSYNGLLEVAGNPPPGRASGGFLRVSAVLGDDGVELLPIYAVDGEGDVGPGEGDMEIRLVDASDQTLFVRNTDPVTASTVSLDGAAVSSMPFIVEFVPALDDAALVRIVGPDGNVLAERDLTGAPPQVSIVTPAGGGLLEGVQTIAWSATDPDSTALVYRVQYSSDGGRTWQGIAQDISRTNLAVDFAVLAGSGNGSLIRVLASDGAQTGTAVSAPFSVPDHPPSAEIVAPAAGREYHVSDMVLLRGNAFDHEDSSRGALTALWSSSLDGVLGEGPDLALDGLSAGTHELRFLAIDSDGNQADDTVTVTVASDLPPEEIVENDEDGDGVPAGFDCDDGDGAILPGATEIGNNGIDEDCDGEDLTVPALADADGDGFSPAAGDCDDTDALTFRGAPELPGDGVDNDCSGSDLRLCDADRNDTVDIADIGAVFAARNQATDELDPRDADRDRWITVLDGRICYLQCDLPGCASP